MGTRVISGRIKNPPCYKMEGNLENILPMFELNTYYGYTKRSVPQNSLRVSMKEMLTPPIKM